MRDPKEAGRRKSAFWFGTLGVVGSFLIGMFTIVGDSPVVPAALGGEAGWVIALFVVFSISLALLRFELSESIFVSIGVSSFVAMIPVLGPVLTAWLAPLTAMVPRLFQIGRSDPRDGAERSISMGLARAISLFGIYGIPAVVAGSVYLGLGGEVPLAGAGVHEMVAISAAALTFFLSNAVVMFFVMALFGYPPRRRLRLLGVDVSIYVVMLPYSLALAFSYAEIGLTGLVLLMVIGLLMNVVTRSLALSREEGRAQVQRMASMSNIGRAISLGFSRDELLRTVYEECSKVVDTEMFQIALYNEATEELSWEIIVDRGVMRPKSRAPLGEGLNSWVVENRKPLLLASLEEERERGLSSIDDGLSSESWLGVPMTVRDRVIGVISIQSGTRNAFRPEDLLMLTAVANQAAVALESLDLYSDLESLTMALEERVNERTRELRDANLRLRTADRTKSQFLANMSHELRTPLNSIIGFSTVLLDRDRQQLAPRMRKFLENIHSAGTHLLELINDILDISKIEAGRMAIDIEEFDLRGTIASVRRVMSDAAREKGVRISVEVEPEIRLVTLDESRLKQILLNLLSNAVKFSNGGSTVELRVKAIPRDVSTLGVDTISYEVRDHGIGISEDELDRIFDQFYQTDPARRTRGGTGLGLSLVKNFVEMLGGRISVDSEPGVGSTFTVELPKIASVADKASATDEEGELYSESSSGEKKNSISRVAFSSESEP